MNSRIVWGCVITFFGLVLVVISPFLGFVPLIYGISILIIGIFILYNKKEDQIEGIKKKMKGGKSKSSK